MKEVKIQTILILMLMTLSACNVSETEIQQRKDKFEKHIGNKNAKSLTILVDEFENILKGIYKTQNIDTAYLNLLIEASDKSFLFDSLIAKHGKNNWLINTRKEIDLFTDLWITYDSVWQENDYLLIEKSTKEIDTVFYMDLGADFFNSAYRVEDYMDDLKTGKEINKNGKYFTALNSIKKNDKFINDYIDIILNFKGYLDSESFSFIILNGQPVTLDYFIKRIIVVEFIN